MYLVSATNCSAARRKLLRGQGKLLPGNRITDQNLEEIHTSATSGQSRLPRERRPGRSHEGRTRRHGARKGGHYDQAVEPEARAPSFVDALPAFLELFAAPSLPRRDLEAVKRDLTVVDDEQHVADVANIDERTAVERQRGLLRNLLV